MKKTKEEYDYREKMIARIEGIVGSMETIPWSEISTEDMEKLFLELEKRNWTWRKTLFLIECRDSLEKGVEAREAFSFIKWLDLKNLNIQ